ncbi:unnamed protein product [Ectocarpus sp. 6 AP-2014]
MEAEHRRRSDERERAAYDGSSPASAAVLGSTTDCLTPPKLDGQGGDRDLALAMKPERAVRTAWPDRAAGRATGGYCERSGRGGGGGGGGRNARAVSPILPLEGLHKMEGCFVTPKKISGHVLLGNRGGGGGARRMGVSPSDHEPVRIAPMVRHDRSDDDDNNNNHSGGTLYDEDSGGAATSMHTRTAAKQHENDRAYTLGFSTTEARPVDRGGRRTGSTGATAVVDDFPRKQTESSRFVVGRSSERMSAAESMGRAGGGGKRGASRGQAAAGCGPPCLGGVAAAELLTVEHDEWKEARTAEGKIYYYNRRTRVPRWTLPPTATYVPDPNRPAGYRIFALAATVNIKIGDKSTAPASATSGSERTSGGVIDPLLRGPGGAGAGGAQEADSSRERFGRDNGGGGGAPLSNAPTLSEVTPMTTSDLESPAASSPTTAATAGPPTTPATASARVKNGVGTTGCGDGGAVTTPKPRFVVHKSGLRAPSSLSAATAAAAAASASAAATPSTLPETRTTATTDDADNQKNDARNRRRHLPREPARPAAARSPRANGGTVETLTATENAYTVSASPAPPTGCFSADETASLVEKIRDDNKHPERPVSPTAPRLSCSVGHAMSVPCAGGGAGIEGGAAPPGAGGSTGGQAAAVGGRGPTVGGRGSAVGEGKTPRRQVEDGVEVGSACLTEVLPDEPTAETTRTAAAAAAAVREGEEFETEAQLTVDSPTTAGTGPVETDKELEMEAAMATGQQGLSSQSGGAGQRKEDQRHHVGGGGSPSSQTSSSASLQDFVHYVRVQSGGRGDASLSSPAPRSNRTRGGGQAAGAMRSGDAHMSKDKEAFSSERIPGTFHRRPLGPVRRSEEMEHPLSSRSKPQEHHPHQGPKEPAAITALWATAAETPTTALAGVPVYQTHHYHHHPSSRSRRSAQADTVRYSGSGVGGGKAAGGGDTKGSSSAGGGLLPGSSVLRHRVRRQLFSEDSEARPLVFCPFCGEGVVRAGGLRDHLQECYVLDRCRGSETHKQVEVAIRAVSIEHQMHTSATNTHGKGASSLNGGSFQDSSTLLQHALPPFVSKGNGPENVLAPAVASKNSELGGVVATGGGRGAAAGEVSGVGSEVSLGEGGAGGAEEERCEDCGRTFAPGRLRSHAKACRSVFLERRRPYDPKAMRAKGTPLEFFQQPIGAASSDGNPSTSGKGGDGGGTAASRRGVGRNKPSSVGGSSVRREGSSQSGGADCVSPGGLDVSVGTGGGSSRGGGGEVGGSFLRRRSKKVALKTLPAVEGSARCPFCSSSIPRAKLSVHLLRCKKLRRSQTCPRPEASNSLAC